MATVEKTVSVLFFGDDQLSDKVTSIQKSFSSFTGSVEAIAAPLAGVADDVLKVDAALTALAIGGLAYAFAKSVEYEQATIELQKVMGENETITKDLEDQFTTLSRTYGESTTSIISALAELRQSGYTTAEGMEVLDVSLQLNRASELETEEATNLLKRALIGYNLEVEDARTLGDLWNHTSQVANTNVTKLAEGFAKVARQADDAGFSLSETAAVLTPMIGVFDSGDEAGTAFSMMLSRMIDPTARGEAAIRMLTGATGPLNEEFASGKELFEAVAIGLQKVDDRTGAVAVAQIVGVQQAKRIKVAFDDYFKTLEKIGPAADQYNSLQKEVDLQNASSRASVDRLVVGFEALASTVGTQFRAAASEAIDGSTAIENALEDIIKDGTFKPIFDALGNFGIEIGDYLEKIAKAMPEAFKNVNFDDLLDAFGDIGEEMKSIFDGLDLTKPKDLKTAIQFVVDSLESLVRVTKGMIEVFEPMFIGIMNSTKAFNDLDNASKESAGNLLGAAKAIIDLGVMIGLALVTIGQHAGTVQTIFKDVATAIGFMWDSTAIVVDAALLLLTKSMQKLVDLFGYLPFTDWTENASKELGIFADFLEKDITERSKENLDRLSYAFGTTTDAVGITTDAVKKATKAVEDFAKTDAEIALQIETDRAELQKVADEIFGFVDGVKVDVDNKKPTVKVAVDTTEATRAVDSFYMKMVEIDGEMVEVKVYTDCDITEATQKIAEVKKDVEEFPKELEIKLKGEIDTEIARIETQGKTAQTAMEWTAKLNIAEAEADASILVAMFDGISNSITSTGDALGGLFGLLTDPDVATWDKWSIEEQIEKENKMRKEAFEQQSALNEAQLAYTEARTAALESGEGLINITADGLEPEISAFMWKILEKIQIRANEASAEFLLGIEP